MLYFSLALIALISSTVRAQHIIERGTKWNDLMDCDHDEWEFENPDPNVHARHRDSNEDLIDTCYFGEFYGGDGDATDNAWGEATWNVVDTDGVTPYHDFMLEFKFRIWAFCDWRPEDGNQIWVTVCDDWNGSGYDRCREIFRSSKNRRNCDDYSWTAGPLTTGDASWLDELTCVVEQPTLSSCYADVAEIRDILGDRFRVRFESSISNGEDRSAWAWSDIMMEVNPVMDGPCCTGERNDAELKPSKSCKVFRELTNCEAKGCNWDLDRDVCRIPCCRKKEPDSKEKPKCKSLSDTLERCGVSPRRDCETTMCDCQGFWDGLVPPEGVDCNPRIPIKEFNDYP